MSLRRSLIVFSFLISLSVVLAVLNFAYPSVWLQKGYYTFAALGVIYLIFEVLLEQAVLQKIEISNARYSVKKTLSTLSLATYALALLIIWLTETQYILLSLGLIGAAIAFGLQDIFKNFAGGLMIFFTGIYHVGDRIEIDEKCGDVIDVGILYTTLMEIREWVSGDQVTGRLSIFPNGRILTGTVQNFTKDLDFIWDELTIPITYDSDWKEAQSIILEIVKKETSELVEQADGKMRGLRGRYYFTKRQVEPSVFVTLTDNWISFGVRYVTEVRTRRGLNNKLSRAILEEIEKSRNVRIASSTISITSFPKVKFVPDKKVEDSSQM